MAGNNSVRVEVDTLLKSDGFVAAAKGAKTVGDAADAAGRQLTQMDAKLTSANERARKLAEAEEKAAEKARRMAEDLALLRLELAKNGDESGQLSRRINRLTTDTRFAAEATDSYRRAANRAAAEAREQARAYDRVADNARQAARAVALLGAESLLSKGGKRGTGIFSEISSGFLKQGLGGASAGLEGALGTPVLGPALIAGGAAAAIPAASFAGGALGGATLAAGGLAAAGLGLAGAWQSDPAKFRGMWDDSINHVERRWLDSSKAFGNELTGALKTADATLQRLPIEKVLALSQSFVAPIATGAGQGLAGAANGFADALEKVQPIIDKIGPKIGNLGHDIGDAFRMISEGSKGGGDALGDLIDAIGGAIKVTGLLILGFEQAYERIRNFAIGVDDTIDSISGVGQVYEGLKGALFGVAETSTVVARTLGDSASAAHDTAFDWGEMGQAAAAAELSALGLNDSLTKLRDTQLGMADANIAVAQGWLDLKKGLEDGAKSLDLNTQAGIDNQKTIRDQVAELERQREQTIANGDQTQASIAQANAAYDAGIERIKAMAKAAGFTDAQVNALLTSLGAFPPSVTTNVQTPGLGSALAQGIALGNALNRIDGQTYAAQVVVRYHTEGQSLNAPLRTGGIPHAAAGGPQGRDTMVGEAGPEVVRLPTGSMVYPHANAEQMAMQAMGGRGGGRTETVVRIEGSGELYELLMAAQLSGALQIFTQAIVD